MALTVALLFAIGAFHVFAAIGGIFAAWQALPAGCGGLILATTP